MIDNVFRCCSAVVIAVREPLEKLLRSHACTYVHHVAGVLLPPQLFPSPVVLLLHVSIGHRWAWRRTCNGPLHARTPICDPFVVYLTQYGRKSSSADPVGLSSADPLPVSIYT